MATPMNSRVAALSLSLLMTGACFGRLDATPDAGAAADASTDVTVTQDVSPEAPRGDGAHPTEDASADATLAADRVSSDACIPKTCAELGYDCGQNPDGCGGILNCGSCPSPSYCGGGGYSQCGGSPCGGGPCTCETVDAYCADPSNWCVRDWASASTPGAACVASGNFYLLTPGPCGGVDLVIANVASDVVMIYVYDAQSGALIAVISDINNIDRCVAGDSSYATNCIANGDGGCCWATVPVDCPFPDASAADASSD
jgi:hypothetical protein